MNSPHQQLASPTPSPAKRLRVMWVGNVALLVLICGWIVCSPQSRQVIESSSNSMRQLLALPVTLAVLFSLMGIAAGLFNGPPPYRSLRAWLSFTALLSGWCALLVSWQTLYGFGQTMRFWWDVPKYEQLAAELHDHWPGQDGNSPELGHFLAYPLGNPQTLLLVGMKTVPGGAPIAAIERSDQGAIRFQMAGAETGPWLEWHPEGSEPATFVGGLENRNELIKATRLRPHWYLVRYRGSVNPD